MTRGSSLGPLERQLLDWIAVRGLRPSFGIHFKIPRLDDISGIGDIREGDQNMDVYRSLLEENFIFSTKGYHLRYIGGEMIRPFRSWKEEKNPPFLTRKWQKPAGKPRRRGGYVVGSGHSSGHRLADVSVT